MELIKTKNFELAVCAAGNEQASRLALLLPGYLDTKDYRHMQSHVNFLAQKGCYALSFDPPGTWESPGDISLYTTKNYLKSIDDLIEMLGNRPTVVMGHSRGGSMAILAGIHNPHITHIIAVMPPRGPSKRPAGINKLRTSYRDVPPGAEQTKEKKRFDLPISNFEKSTEYAGLDSCTKPKLFFLGKRDDLLLPEDVREIYELAAEPKQLHELNSDHDYRYHSNIISEVNKITGMFLEETNF